jgi:hypothetical protein
MVNSPTVIYAYVGAQPGGRPAPDLTSVPVMDDPNLTFVFTLAFANDVGGGNFVPQWDPAITPELISKVKASNPSVSFRASLGGDANYGPWRPPADQPSWIGNAAASLNQLIDTYDLDGLDIDYEGGPAGLDDSFVACMSQVIINLSSPRQEAFTSLAPFGQTAGVYQSLWQQCGTWITSINYQAYADDIPDVQGYLDLYAQVSQQYHGYQQIGLGIASSNVPGATRGLQPQDIYTVWDSLHAHGSNTVTIWCLEDSQQRQPPFTIETAIQARS